VIGAVDGDDRVAGGDRDRDMGSECGGRDPGVGNVQQVLAARRVGVEPSGDRVVAEVRRKPERVVAGGAVHRVVAGTTDADVVAAGAGQRVVAGTAGDGVVERVAGAVEDAGADEDQVLDVGTQREGVGRRQHRVGAPGGRLVDVVGGDVDPV